MERGPSLTGGKAAAAGTAATAAATAGAAATAMTNGTLLVEESLIRGPAETGMEAAEAVAVGVAEDAEDAVVGAGAC